MNIASIKNIILNSSLLLLVACSYKVNIEIIESFIDFETIYDVIEEETILCEYDDSKDFLNYYENTFKNQYSERFVLNNVEKCNTKHLPIPEYTHNDFRVVKNDKNLLYKFLYFPKDSEAINQDLVDTKDGAFN